MGASGGAGLAYHSEAPNSLMVFKGWPIFTPFFVLYYIVLSNSSEGDPVGIFKCGSRKEKYLGSITI